MKNVYIELAKAAIRVALHQRENFSLDAILKEYPQLREKGAAFVTLNTRSNNQLRGCIGSLQAHRPLFEDIISNAQAAALRDPRFPPLAAEELHDIKIEVSILSEPKPLIYSDREDLKRKITPMQDGIILSYNQHRATYLPQVWEQLPHFDTFFSSLCIKAGLSGDCLSSHPEIEVYRVTKYEEN